MVHLLFGPEVHLMLEEDNREEMKAFLENLHPATVAEALAGEFTVEQVWRFLENTSIRHQAAIFEYFPLEWQIKLVEGAGRERMAHLIEKMSHDDRVDLLRRLMPRVAEGLLRLVDEADRRDIATLVNQKEGTAGALMTTDYAWLPPHVGASEALRLLRLQAPDRETIYYVFVLDDQHRILGVVSLRDLILAPPQALIRDIMEEQVVSVKASDDPEHVANELAHYDLLAIPVVDDQNRMVGIITHDDLMDVVVQEATEDVLRLGAVGPMLENYLEAGFLTIWRTRAFWLACLFIGGTLTILALAQFHRAIESIVALSFFIPLCISTGGNSGSQAATLITRALALGHVSGKDWWRILRHEVLMGLALGLTLGVLGFASALITNQILRPDPPVNPWLLGAVVATAVVVICLWGTVVGAMLPLVFKQMGVDPGVASSPFVAMLVDVTGILIYFSIAKLVLLS
jgi:magnesium transporter